MSAGKKFREEYDEEYYNMKIYPKKHMIRYVLHVLGMLSSPHDVKWLDVGCGVGNLLKDLLEEGVDAYGIEISEAAINSAPPEVRPRITRASILKIPFKDEEFDVVSAIDVIEHVHPRDTFRSISELCRVTKPGGYLVLTTPNPCKMGWVYDLTHINVKPAKFWKIALEDACYEVKLKYVPSDIISYFMTSPLFVEKTFLRLGEPLRRILGWYYYHIKGRLYLLAEKTR